MIPLRHFILQCLNVQKTQNIWLGKAETERDSGVKWSPGRGPTSESLPDRAFKKRGLWMTKTQMLATATVAHCHLEQQRLKEHTRQTHFNWSFQVAPEKWLILPTHIIIFK